MRNASERLQLAEKYARKIRGKNSYENNLEIIRDVIEEIEKQANNIANQPVLTKPLPSDMEAKQISFLLYPKSEDKLITEKWENVNEIKRATFIEAVKFLRNRKRGNASTIKPEIKDIILIDISIVLEKIFSNEFTNAELVPSILEVLNESMKDFKKKLDSDSIKRETMESQDALADACVNMMTNAITIIVSKYSLDVVEAPYTIPSNKLKMLKDEFKSLLISGLDDKLLNSLFLNNILLANFNGILKAIEYRKIVLEQRGNTGN